ncbi:MAG: hypothetical protein ACTTH8_04755 [Treponema sp.]
MKKSILLSVSFVLLVPHLFAIDFGFDLSNSTGLTGKKQTVSVIQINKAGFFTSIPTGNIGTCYLSADARFAGYFPLKPKEKHTIIPLTQSFVVGRTEWFGNKTINALGTIGITWNIGRTDFGGYSGKVFTGLFDGFKLGLLLPNAELRFSTAYTGLTYTTDAGIRLAADTDDKKMLSDSRIVLGFSASFPTVIPAHLIGFDIVAQCDLSSHKNRIHTQYAVPYIGGKIGRNISWKCWHITEFGQDSQFFYSFAAGTSVQYFKPEWRNLGLKGEMAWAAGDYDGTGALRAFTPVTSTSALRIASHLFTDAFAVSGGASCNPVRDCTVDAVYGMLLTPNSGNKESYGGSEISSKASYKIHNDLDLALLCGVFVPKQTKIEQKVRWLANLSCTIHL